MARRDAALPAVLMANRRRIDCQRDHFSLETISEGLGEEENESRGSPTRLTACTKYFAYERLPLLCFLPIHKPLSLLSRGMRHEWQLTLPHECFSRLNLVVRRGRAGKKSPRYTTVMHSDAGCTFRGSVSRGSRETIRNRCMCVVYVCVYVCVCLCCRMHRRRALLEERRHETRCNLIDRES